MLEVHNHHNYAWLEDGLWVVRKGATPLTMAPSFIGGSMGDISVIVRGEAKNTLGHTDSGSVERHRRAWFCPARRGTHHVPHGSRGEAPQDVGLPEPQL